MSGPNERSNQGALFLRIQDRKEVMIYMFLCVQNGSTPLHRAVTDGHVNIVKYLIKSGSSLAKTDEV